jgi:hypothetical protein
MSIQKKEIEYAKEIGDVFVLVEEIIKSIKNKSDYMSLLPSLVDAVNGAPDVDDEFEANRKAAIQTATYHVGGIVDTLLPVKK